jgi:hypothetical protein
MAQKKVLESAAKVFVPSQKQQVLTWEAEMVEKVFVPSQKQQRVPE